MARAGRTRLVVLMAVAVVLVCAAPASAVIVDPAYVHAHRGGPLVNGAPAYPENSLPAFAHAAAGHYTLELDVKITSDGLPVVIHDDTLDRTTNCSGAVRARSAADLAANCRLDVNGLAGTVASAPIASPTEPVPTLAQVLALAVATGSPINLEIKNLPTDGDFDVSPNYANRVMDVVLASGIAPSKVIIQSFWPTNLSTAAQRMPGAARSLLTQKELELVGPVGALLFSAKWVSPAWPFALPTTMLLANLLGQKVVPYTLDQAGSVQTAYLQGADAVITNDPPMAQAALLAVP